MDVVSSVKNYFKPQTICIDTKVFKLHYKATVLVLVVSSLLVSSKQYIGDPIKCLSTQGSSEVLEAYCWIHSTYTVTKRFGDEVGKEVIAPGVGSHSKDGDDIVYHTYYQWMVFFLIGQAILFYLPRFLWKTWEGGKLKCLAPDMNICLINEKEKDHKINNIVEYFRDNLQTHNTYAYRFFFCEILNLVIVLINIFSMDAFINGEFRDYGLQVIKFLNEEQKIDPLAKVFPKITKCMFYTVGPSGSLNNIDSLCILSINILNEKLMVFLWFWYIILAIFSCCAVVYRILVIVSPRLRFMLLAKRCRLTKAVQKRFLRRHMQIGDWFLLYQLSKNINLRVYKQFIESLLDVREEKKQDGYDEETTDM